MHITVVCPQCKSRYQVDDALRGKKMRCPNNQCKAIFDVVAEGSVPPPPAPPPRPSPTPARSGQSGAAGDMVPLLSAEVAPRPPAPTPSPALGPSAGDWRTGPPPRAGEAPAAPPPAPKKQPPPPAPRPRTPPTPVARPAPVSEPGAINGTATADWRFAPPPVAGSNETPAVSSDFTTPTPPEDDEDAQRIAKARRARKQMYALIGGFVLIAGIGLFIAFNVIWASEDDLASKAMKLYEEGRYVPAATAFRQVADKFPESSSVSTYRFYASLADLRGSDGGDIVEALEKLNNFLNDRQNESTQRLLDERGRDLGQTFVQTVTGFFESEGEKDTPDLEKPLAEIETTVGRLARQFPGSVTPEERKSIETKVKDHRELIANGKERTKALEQMRQMARKKGAEAINEVKRFHREKSLSIKGLENNEEALKLLSEMHDAHRSVVVYKPAAEMEPPTTRRAEDTEPSILLDPPTVRPPKPQADDGVVLAVIRGMLYALSPSNGQIKWAMRVGIDTARLPVILPPALGAGERLLVLSDDARLLTALDLSGRRLWEYRLGAACLGRPLIVKNKAYLPTFDGQVHEIKLTDGKLEGRWSLGQPLSVGGAHQKGTNLVYFPADDTCVYVLDVGKKTCEMILYTGHLAGSLRGEPLVLGDEVAGVGPYLLLTQSSGFDETGLKLYQLPVTDRHAPSLAMNPQPRVQGWTWFTPYADCEKIVCLSDAARLGLFGIRQARNNDNPLFPIVRHDGASQAGIDLTDLLRQTEGERRARALVAHVLGDDIWVLANGRLQRLELRLGRGSGPQVISRWKKPLDLGAPLHEEQVREVGGENVLYLVTEPAGHPGVLVTAINPEGDENAAAGDPRIRWQRQFGVVCQGDPVTLGEEVLAMDRAGGLFRFKPDEYDLQKGGRWLAAPEGVRAGAGMGLAANGGPQLLRADAQTVYAIANPGGNRLVVRQYQTPPKGAKPTVAEMETEVGSRVAGDAVVQGGSLVVPLSNGTLVRYKMPLQPGGLPEAGPTWRSRRAGAEGRCYVVPLGGDEFLTTDGLRGVSRWQWKGQAFQFMRTPQRKDPPAVELEGRIVGAPLLLPRAAGEPLQFIVADSSGAVTRVTGDAMTAIPLVELKGRITAGPFLRGSHVGCIVDQTRLVWLDPTKEGKPVWEYKTGGEAIVGEPQLIGPYLVVCNEGGQYVGLNPATGEPAGEGYRLRAAVAPAAAPVPFGKDRAFAPLTDGTLMLLSLDRLKGAGK